MEEYIIKNILKNNPGMSQEDAEKEAHRIQKAYNKANEKEMPKEKKNIEEM